MFFFLSYAIELCWGDYESLKSKRLIFVSFDWSVNLTRTDKQYKTMVYLFGSSRQASLSWKRFCHVCSTYTNNMWCQWYIFPGTMDWILHRHEGLKIFWYINLCWHSNRNANFLNNTVKSRFSGDRLAQLVERRTAVRKVSGSSPTRGPTLGVLK